MTKSLTLSDVLGLGFMTFAFYLGAGNIIFPPLAGYMAGEHLSLAMLGFLVTAVGLPLITIIAVAKAGNGWAGMTKLLPAGLATALSRSPQITLEETPASQAILPTLLKQEQHVCQLFARLPDWTAPALTPATEQAQGATQ